MMKAKKIVWAFPFYIVKSLLTKIEASGYERKL